MIGAKEVKVGNNKVSIERLNVDVVTGLEMDVHTEATLPGTLVAHLTRKEKLTKKYQVSKATCQKFKKKTKQAEGLNKSVNKNNKIFKNIRLGTVPERVIILRKQFLCRSGGGAWRLMIYMERIDIKR